MACELVFLALVTGRTDRAKELLDTQLRKYIDTYRKMMSSKLRILCAIELYINNDRQKAMEIYASLKSTKDQYLFQGEVASDLALMQSLLNI